MTNRWRVVSLWLLLLTGAGPAHGQDQAKARADVKKASPPIQPIVLKVDPAPAPIPALKYRFLPATADLNPGDAAPIYLRLHGYEDAFREPYWRQIGEKSSAWGKIPLDQFPVAEARTFVNRWSDKLEQLEYGTRRRTCDWNYTLPEQRLDGINILLPDAQAMRQWERLLGIKARLEIAEKKYDDAIHTIETGVAFGRHAAEGPFLINGLVGVAIASTMLAELDELIAQPGAPNLYWALTALPRPLIDFRHHFDNERKLCVNLIPELAEALSDRPKSNVEWEVLLAHMHQNFMKWCKFLASPGGVSNPRLTAMSTWSLEQFRGAVGPGAMDYLVSIKRLERPRTMPGVSADKVAALYIAARYEELWDDVFKASYLPAREASSQLAAAEKRLRAAKEGPMALIVGLTPSIEAVMRSQVHLDRRIAILRVIEALRLYAAAHDGRLPESLDQVTEVPVPDDPATGEPFIYRAADSAAILHGLRAGLPYPPPTYRITIRRAEH